MTSDDDVCKRRYAARSIQSDPNLPCLIIMFQHQIKTFQRLVAGCVDPSLSTSIDSITTFSSTTSSCDFLTWRFNCLKVILVIIVDCVDDLRYSCHRPRFPSNPFLILKLPFSLPAARFRWFQRPAFRLTNFVTIFSPKSFSNHVFIAVNKKFNPSWSVPRYPAQSNADNR